MSNIFIILAKPTLNQALAGTVMALLTSVSAATEKRCYAIDLKSNATPTLSTSFIEWVVPPEDSNNDGWFEAVLKIKINDPSLSKSPKAAQFKIYYDGTPSGMTVDLGDSSTNDGFSGDFGTQSNDAEVQIGGRLDIGLGLDFNDLSVFAHDGYNELNRGEANTNQAQLAQINNLVKQNETVILTVSNERIGYRNDAISLSGHVQSPWLYALNGQSDTEGPVNYDIFASFNRAIAGNYRLGSGVGNVKVCLLSPHEFAVELFNEARSQLSY